MLRATGGFFAALIIWVFSSALVCIYLSTTIFLPSPSLLILSISYSFSNMVLLKLTSLRLSSLIYSSSSDSFYFAMFISLFLNATSLSRFLFLIFNYWDSVSKSAFAICSVAILSFKFDRSYLSSSFSIFISLTLLLASWASYLSWRNF